jgi:sec-independent protein translocase protein TatA
MGFTPTPVQILIVLALGVLIFGKNLPDVAKQIGSAFGEFKKGLREMSDLSKMSADEKVAKKVRADDDLESTEKHHPVGTKFVPPEG